MPASSQWKFTPASGAIEKPALLRQLGLVSATALVISNMVGTGIFASTGYLAGDLGYPSLVLMIDAPGFRRN